MSTNTTIKKLLDDHIIPQEQFDILFEPKDTWYIENNGEQDWTSSQNKIEKFYEAFKYIFQILNDTNTIDLTYIHFPPFTLKNFSREVYKYIKFNHAHFYGISDFSFTIFHGVTMFNSCIFHSKADFDFTEFKKGSSFYNIIFKHEAYFSGIKFHDDCNFGKTEFRAFASFRNSLFEKLFDLENIKITKLDLNNARFDDTNLLGISSYDEAYPNSKPLTKTNFSNRETARLIKAHLEMQNNITESNKYFALEQELYLDELLKPNSVEPNRWQTIITLFLNKYVSHFGTDWLRSLIVLILFGYIVMMGYMGFDHIGWLLDDKDKSVTHFHLYQYLPLTLAMITGWGFLYRYTFTKDIYLIFIALIFIVLAFVIADTNNLGIRAFTNYIVQITNPIGAFKDVELYKGIEFYATIVRITIAVMIYQLIVAFRNNTRRS